MKRRLTLHGHVERPAAPPLSITDRRITTSRERFTAVFGAQPPARILLEASTEREWAARHLESLGHAVIVADPKYAPMYANRSSPASRIAQLAADARGCGSGCGASASLYWKVCRGPGAAFYRERSQQKPTFGRRDDGS